MMEAGPIERPGLRLIQTRGGVPVCVSGLS